MLNGRFSTLRNHVSKVIWLKKSQTLQYIHLISHLIHADFSNTNTFKGSHKVKADLLFPSNLECFHSEL